MLAWLAHVYIVVPPRIHSCSATKRDVFAYTTTKENVIFRNVLVLIFACFVWETIRLAAARALQTPILKRLLP
jgi:hypothetical protein